MRATTIIFGLLACLPGAALAQAYPLTVVQFTGGPDQLVELSSAKAVAYDGTDKPLFKAQKAFLLGFTGNTAGRVFTWDLTRRKVRISLAGRPAIWLSCDDLKPMALACATSLRVATDGALVVSGGGKPGPVRGAGNGDPLDPGVLQRLPDCPGDPRCP